MDFFKKAMDSVTSTDDNQKPSTQPTSTDDNQKPSTHPQVTHTTSHTELLASAKVLAEAAQSSVQNKAVDKAKVAEAADDVLHAASQYGKLEEKGYGQYVEKAETYLHGQFNSGDPSAEHSAPAEPKAEPKESEKSEGGLGDVMKMAQGSMK